MNLTYLNFSNCLRNVFQIAGFKKMQEPFKVLLSYFTFKVVILHRCTETVILRGRKIKGRLLPQSYRHNAPNQLHFFISSYVLLNEALDRLFCLFVFKFIFITIHEIIGGIMECKRKTNKKRKLTKTVLLLHHITKNCGL